MVFFSMIESYISKNLRNMFIFLIFIHIFIGTTLFFIAHTDFLFNLHNGSGLWNFAKDSTKYHIEAVNVLGYIESSQWSDFFSSYPNHQHVKLISLIYWITGIHSPISFEIINSLVWATSILLIYQSSKLLFPNFSKVPLFSILFFFQPSILLSSTQLLRDPIFILGFCFIIYGLTIFSIEKSKWTWIIIVQIGILLMFAMRDYLLIVIIIPLIFFAFINLYKKNLVFVQFILLLSIPLLVFIASNENKYLAQANINYNYSDQIDHYTDLQNSNLNSSKIENDTNELDLQNSNLNSSKIENDTNELDLQNSNLNSSKIENDTNETKQNYYQETNNIEQDKKASYYSGKFLFSLDVMAKKFSKVRSGFTKVNMNAGSAIDKDLQYDGIYSMLVYLPRALQLGFLSPFPNSWLDDGAEVGRIGSVLAGAETFIWYFIYLGFIYSFIKNPIGIFPLLMVFLIGFSIIVLLGYVVPNIGAIYRMRQAYMIPFYIYGIHGLNLLLRNLKNK
jgi:hypothetical protein